MEAFTQKYVIAQFLQPISVGDEFSAGNWPLHATIAGVFAIDWEQDTVPEKLRDLAAHQSAFMAKLGGDAYFGPNQYVHVTLVEPNAQLEELHSRVIELLEQHGGTFNDPQYQKDGFKPHVTVQKRNRLHKGDQISFSELAIVDMLPNQDPHQRKIIKLLPFGKT